MEPTDKLSAVLPHTQTRQEHGGYYFLFSLLTQAQPLFTYQIGLVRKNLFRQFSALIINSVRLEETCKGPRGWNWIFAVTKYIT